MVGSMRRTDRMNCTHHGRSVWKTTLGNVRGSERRRYIEWKSGDEVHLHVLPETNQDGTLDYGELLRRRWTERGTGITKLVIPASLSLAEGLQTRFKFLVNLMEQVDARAMDDMEVIDLSMNSLMLNFLFNQMEHFKRLKILDVSGNYVHEEKQMEFLASTISCYVVNMSLLDMRRLPPCISISNLKVLLLDNNPLIEVIPQDCFANLIKLEMLSMCATGISDLWTTVDGLSRLPALKHLRFQRGCGEGARDVFRQIDGGVWDIDGHADVLWNRAMGGDHEWRQREANLLLSKYDMFPQHASMFEKGHCQAGEEDVIYQRVFETFLARRQSPICLQRNYRQFLIARLPNLQNLDGLQVLPTERDQARVNEDLLQGGVARILTVREVAPSGISHFRSCFQRRSKEPDDRQQCSQRFLQQAGRWPKVREVCASREQPRQFEYHPTVPGIIAVGSADNHLIVQHHQRQAAIGKEEMSVSVGDHMWSSVLGICWFHKHPALLIAGSDNGTIRLFNVNVSGDAGSHSGILGRHRFAPFSDLTSISTNCMDDCFVVSGYSNDVALYDICTHKVVNFFKNLHTDHINVIKFSNLSPHLFATSSFDRDVKMWDLRTDMTRPVFKVTSDAGNVTIGFSHNDQFLLSSATDNDVRQYLVSDGRLHTKLDLEPTGNCNNFTRSYYMRDAEYIISGSCEQPGARICSARSGKVMRQVTFENQDDPRMIVGVQSLRADPQEDLKFSVLTSSEEHYISSSRILEVDLTPCYSGG